MTRTVLEIGPGALAEYYDWMKGAADGDVLVYWQGDLQYDRQVVVSADDVLRSTERARISALHFVADRAFKDSKQGLLHLTQLRIGANLFEYRATRRRVSGSKTTGSDIRNDNFVPA
jgi:hypothetical protein